VGESFTLPTTLQEKYLALPPALKPLNLIHLMHDDQYAVKGGLVFTKSVENVHRLAKLLEFFEDEYAKKQGKGYKKIVVKSYTSDLKPGERKTVLKEFSEGKVHM
jgi:ATP-dependent RNA helicase DDX51/DBP6